MNEQVLNNQMNEGKTPSDSRRRPRSSKKKNARKMRLVSGMMLIVGAMAIFLCLLLVVIPTFRIREIRVEGLQTHSEAEILGVSGLAVGDELFSADRRATVDSILEKCAYVRRVTVKIRFPSTICIVIEEMDAGSVMYTSFNDGWISFDRNFSVLAQSENEADFASFLKVELPAISSMAVGGKIRFADADADLSYVGTVLDTLEASEQRARITEVNLRSKFNVSYVLGDSCRVVLGKMGAMETKLLLADGILERRNPTAEIASVVDVSDVSKCTYRQINGNDVPA